MRRLLFPPEINLLSNLMNNIRVPFNLCNDLNKIEILVLDDGGMGSFEIISNKIDRQFGKVIVEACTLDTDGRKVLLELSIDKDDELYQLDVMTEDFQELKGRLGETGILFDII